MALYAPRQAKKDLETRYMHLMRNKANIAKSIADWSTEVLALQSASPDADAKTELATLLVDFKAALVTAGS